LLHLGPRVIDVLDFGGRVGLLVVGLVESHLPLDTEIVATFEEHLRVTLEWMDPITL